MKIKFRYKKKEISLEVKKVPKYLEGIGLMFSNKNTKPLLFSFKKEVNLKIHSWFVFYDFLAIWLDKDMKVVEKKVVRPFRINILPSRKFKYLIEVPINQSSSELVKILVEEERFK